MARDGSGNFSLLSVLAPPGTTNDPTTINAIMDDIADALSGSINTAGTKPWAANQSLAGFKFTSMGDGSSASDSVSLGQAQKNSKNLATVVAGTVDAIALTFSPAFTSLTAGMEIKWTSGGANTITAPTIATDAIGGTKIIKKGASVALSVGDTGVSGYINRAIYNGTDWILQNPATTVTFTGGTLTTTTSMSGKAFNTEKGANVASAATCDIWTPADGNLMHITGTTDITSFGTAPQAGAERVVIFDGACLLTNGANLLINGAANYTTAAGDMARITADTTTIMKVEIIKQDGTALVSSSSGMTLLATLTTTSGATQSATGLVPASYRKYYIEVDGVSFTAGVPLTMALSGNNGANYGTAVIITVDLAAAGDTFDGWLEIGNINSTRRWGATGPGVPPVQRSSDGAMITGVTVDNYGKNTTGASGAVDAIQFAGGTFDAGEIRIYGVK